MSEGMDDEEEVLSLSDYSINTTTADAAIPDHLFRLESQSLNSVFYQDFEFVSQEWSITSTTNGGCGGGSLTINPQEDIIFCGKLFISSTQNTHNNMSTIIQQDSEKLNKIDGQDDTKKPKLTVIRRTKFSVDNFAVPVLPRQFRWYFLCGITRFPTKIVMRDMKDRQSRKISASSSSTLFGLGGGGGSGRRKEKKLCACKNEGKRQKGMFNIKFQCFSINGEP